MSIEHDIISCWTERALSAEAKLKRIEAWATTPVFENDSVLFCTKDASAGYEMAQALVERIMRGDE